MTENWLYSPAKLTTQRSGREFERKKERMDMEFSALSGK